MSHMVGIQSIITVTMIADWIGFKVVFHSHVSDWLRASSDCTNHNVVVFCTVYWDSEFHM